MRLSAPRDHLGTAAGESARAGGGRAAPRRRRRRRSFRPSIGVLGSAALVAAGVGAVGLSAESAPAAGYHVSLSSLAAGEASNISRGFDRVAFERQSRDQAAQMLVAQQQIAQQVDATETKARAEQELAAEQERARLANQWVLPVTGYSLSARFGQRSSLWSSGKHTGLDFAGPSGSTIVSVAAGTVTEVGYSGAYGNRTVITLKDGTEIWYAHQSRTAVRRGEQVTAGQVIGYTGSTGNVTGPHLHLEVHPGGGAAVDPAAVLRQHNVTP